MDWLNPLSMTNLINSGMAPWLFALTIGVAITLLVWGFAATSSVLLNPLRRRMQALRDSGLVGIASAAPVAGSGRLWAWFEPKKDEQRAGQRTLLSQAGYRSKTALGLFFACKLLLTVLLPVALFVAQKFLHLKSLEGYGMLLALIAAAFVGSRLPGYFLSKRILARQSSLMEGFPDALDLLVACTEAGLSLNAALERVVQQMPASQPDLARELSLVNVEIRAGVDRTAALRNLADRTGLDEIRGLVSLITHSVRLGTGIAGTLRIYAEEFRDRRMQRAEELAAKVGTQLIFPLILFLFPSFFLVAIGPAIINVMRVLADNPLPKG